MITQWFAVRTATRQETRAMDGLKEAGIATYQPMLKRPSRTKTDEHGEPETVERPLLDGYVFIRGDLSDVHAALGLAGVHAVIQYTGNDGRLHSMPIPAREIDSLRQREKAGEFDFTERKRARPGKGDRVRITKGLFLGYIGEVIEASADHRRVILQLARGRAEVSAAHVDVEAA